MTVRVKLLGIALVGAVLTLAVGSAGLLGVGQMSRAEDRAKAIVHAERLHRDLDQHHDILKLAVLQAVLVASGISVDDPDEAQATAEEAAAQFRADLVALDQVPLPPELTSGLADVRADQEAYIEYALRLLSLAGADVAAASGELPRFEAAFRDLDQSQDALTDLFTRYDDRARDDSAAAESRARVEILVVGSLSILLLLALSFLLDHRIVTGLKALTTAARAQQSGELDARAPVGSDEIGSLGTAFNDMADVLGSLHLQLVEHNRLLEERVQERTRELEGAQESLVVARDEALHASRTKSEFLATMSHEIRTPMNGVIGLTGLLLDTELTETQRHHAEGVRGSGEALLGIINDILDFSKIEAGKLELETVDFDLTHAIEEVAALVSESARAKGLELVAYCRPEVPSELRGDVGRLRQILLNFTTNAVKFTAAGEVVLRARLDDDQTSERVVVRFEVTDTGVGIAPAEVERLFEPFSQSDASTTRRYGGTGLGLAICRRLAEAMDGAVGVDSRPGQGSTFWLRLPLDRALRPLAREDLSAHSLQGRRVLVVDDNQTNRLVLTSQLRAWDITADPAADGAEALERLRGAAARAENYDLALVDMAMPGMDGLDLAAVIRSDPELASVILLLLSSVSVEAEAVTQAGFVARLTKPVRLSNLYDALVRAVAPTAPEAGKIRSPSRTDPAGSRGTVLIVEDHAINQEVAKGIVAKLGYGSDVAGNGIEALEALERRSYDAVLMDCHMPEMDGFEATAEIRRREAGGSHVPIIAMTAGALVEDREKCIAAGMDDYLSKPVKARELEAVLDRWLGRNEPVPDPETVTGGPEGPAGVGVLDTVQFDGLRQLAAGSGDPAFLARLVDQYVEHAGSRLAELQEAAARGDAGALRQAAHGLRGSSATMGAGRVASACAALEEAAARGETEGTAGVEQIAFELERATASLRREAAPGD